MYYGMLLTDSTLLSVNALGSLLFATYTWIYYKYTSKKVSLSKNNFLVIEAIHF